MPSARWRPYAFAAALTLVTLLLRLALGDRQGIEELFVLPIIVGAYLGGRGPGLLATAIAALGVLTVVHIGAHDWSVSAALANPDWILLAIVGSLVSFLSEAFHRARRRAESAAAAAESALAEQVKLQVELSRVVATAPGILYSFRLRPDGTACVPFASEGVRNLFGIEADVLEKDASPIFAMMPPEDAVRVQAAIARSVESRALFREEFRIRRADGREVWVDAHSMPLFEADGSVLWHGYINDVTDRKRSEVALRSAQENLQRLIEQAPVAIAMLDRDLRYVVASRRWLKDYGRGFNDLVGRYHYDVLPDVPEHWKSQNQHALAGQVRIERESLWVQSDGSQRWLHWEKHPWRNGSGEVDGIIIFAEDVTERKLAAEALLLSERRYRDLVQLSPDGILVARDARLTFVNQAAVGMFRASSPDDLVGRDVLSLIHQDDQAVVTSVEAGMRTGETMPPVRVRILRFDGTELEIEGAAALLSDESGRPTQMVIRDITERRRAETALRRSEERFRQLADTIHEVFWMSNADASVIEYVSPAYESIWGRTCESLYAMPEQWIEAIHELDRNRVLGDALPKHAIGLFDVEYRIVRPDGSIRWIRDRGFPVRDDNGQVIRMAGVAADVTEHRELESQLRQAQKIESVGLLAGGVAHDFNNWLTVITANGELLQSCLSHEHEGYPLVTEIREAGDRAAQLTRQLLALSRQQVLEPRVVNVNTIVSDAERLLRRLIGEDITLETELGPVSDVLVDPGHLHQVIMNLAVNARDAMPTGGTLTIFTGEFFVNDLYALSHPGLETGRYVRLSVTDTGVGMTADTCVKVFDPFFTTKGLGHGTGLGLSVVHGIVSQSGGRIDVTSAPGQGTTFTILLPAIEGAAPVHASVPDEIPATPAEGILLVEDESSVRRVAARSLTAAGYRVIEAVDGLDALRQFEQHRTEIDLVVTDVVMPNMSGRQFVDAIGSTLPVLYTSGYLDDAVVRHGVMHAEVAFLQKPYSAQSLIDKVREVLRHAAKP
jgi:PAS domain S-box-containing protein